MISYMISYMPYDIDMTSKILDNLIVSKTLATQEMLDRIDMLLCYLNVIKSGKKAVILCCCHFHSVHNAERWPKKS